jgi:hypothetical protein
MKKRKKAKALTQQEVDKMYREYFALPEVQESMRRIMTETKEILGMNDEELEGLKKLSRQEFLFKVLPLIKNGMRRQAAEKSDFKIN